MKVQFTHFSIHKGNNAIYDYKGTILIKGERQELIEIQDAMGIHNEYAKIGYFASLIDLKRESGWDIKFIP